MPTFEPITDAATIAQLNAALNAGPSAQGPAASPSILPGTDSYVPSSGSGPLQIGITVPGTKGAAPDALPSASGFEPITDPATVAQMNAALAGTPDPASPNAPNPMASSLPGPLGQLANTSNAMFNGMAQGATGNLSDELFSGVAAPFRAAYDATQGHGFDLGRAFNYEQTLGNQVNQNAAALNPVANVAGQIAGGVGLGTGLASKGVTLMAGATPTLMSMVPRAMGEGAAYGALYGFGGGTDLQDRLAQAGTGAAVGGVLGGLGGAIATPFMAAAANKTGMLPDAVTHLQNAFAADNSAGGAGAARVMAAGPNAMAADSGRNAQALLDLATHNQGPGMDAAYNAVQQRAAQAAQTVKGSLNAQLGAPEGLFTTTQVATGAAKAPIAAAYKDAYAHNINWDTPHGENLLAALRRVPKRVLESTRELMQTDGVDPLTEGAIEAVKGRPTVQHIDYIKRALMDTAYKSDGQGKMGGFTNEGRVFKGLATDIRDAATKAVPAYGKALSLAADPITQINAAKMGRELLFDSTPIDRARADIAKMGPKELEALKANVNGYIQDLMDNVRTAISNPNAEAKQAAQALNMLSAPATKAKLGLIPGVDMPRLTRELDQATSALHLQASVRDNSATALRRSTLENSRIMTQEGLLMKARQAKPIEVPQRLIQNLTQSSPQHLARHEQKVFGQVADALTQKRGQDAADFIDQILRSGKLAARSGLGAPSHKVTTMLSALLAARGDMGDRQVTEAIRPTLGF